MKEIMTRTMAMILYGLLIVAGSAAIYTNIRVLFVTIPYLVRALLKRFKH